MARLGAGRLDQDVARVVVQVEAFQHDAVQVEAIPVEELRKIIGKRINIWKTYLENGDVLVFVLYSLSVRV